MSGILARKGLVLFAGLALLGLALRGSYGDGVPEPGLTFQGKVSAAGGLQLTQGRLTWTLTPVSGGTPVVVSTDLLPLVGAVSGTTFSYRIHIPSEMASGALPIGSNCLPVTTNLVTYRRYATLDGAYTTIVSAPTTVTFGASERGKSERVDLVIGISDLPGVPSSPSPANGQVLVPLDTPLDWADAAFAQTYDLYLWQTGYTKPPTPTQAGLTQSRFQPPALLRPDVSHSWQVIARNTKGSTAGPVWVFRTAFQGDLQTLLEYLLGKRYLTFQEQSLLDLNADTNVDVADFVKGLKRGILYGPPVGQTAETADGASQSPALLAPVTISIGSATVTTSKTTTVALPVNVSPAVTGVAGLNLKIEADPALIQLTGIRVKQVNAGEFLYSYCPYSGVMNVVFFANPVASLKSSGATVLTLDLKATLLVRNSSTAIRLTAASVSDVNGTSNASVTRSDGSVRYTPPLQTTRGRRWEIYR